MKKINLKGHKYGMLTVIQEAPKTGHGVRWECRCDCGGRTTSLTNNLRRGIATSCGCIGSAKTIKRNKDTSTHGMRSSDMYSLWKQLYKHTVVQKWECTKKGGKYFTQWAIDNGWKVGNKYTLILLDETKPIGPDNCKLHLLTPNLTGKKFNRLLVLSKSPIKTNATLWECMCDCSTLTVATTRQLISGGKKSCGCAKRDATIQRNKNSATHGLRNHPLYRIHRGMVNRCKDKSNKYYGAKGVTVCTEWGNVVVFSTWMIQHGWKSGMCIHRKNGDKGYSPNNCELMTRSEHSTLHNNLRFKNKAL